ncbi:Xaa-Pro peptidase family protein [Irregularibacter muris]|uniref:Xaa-Pro peptidase family protein n=1 Tax=Irregularibacter muris TaxID=1796619 RepID=A0AAE3HGZ5_9FIRM|nr:Xaa-Pro peptidase family protein [Irregularibacter muris]MCR1899332.1 Xaa-Pro peptidase family protein [Irregularibacter muris]
MSGFTLEEYQRRINEVVKFIHEEGLDGYLSFNPYNIFYLGLYYYPGKRPVVIYIHKTGEVYAFTPKMEYHGAKKLKQFTQVFAYDDDFHAKADLYDFINKNIQTKLSNKKRIAVDEVDIHGYQRLEEIFDYVVIRDQMMTIRQIKSQEEVDMLRKSALYSDYIVQVGKEMLKPGVTELGLLNRMITKTVDKMIEELGEVIYVPGGPAGALVPSGIRTAMPHALPSGKMVEGGDTMILSCGTNVWGYRTECERTFFAGEPDNKKIKAFQVMKEAQELGIQLMKPGAICEEVERKVIKFITDGGYGEYIRHRTGHGKGLEEHEPPYVAAGDGTIMRPGMVFSSEPGIYMEGFSGFRHSDTIVITEDGCEVLTQYPKDLDSMIIRL